VLLPAFCLMLLGPRSAESAIRSAQKRPSVELETHFAGTDHELRIYRNYGRLDGSTVLIIGGIQGDEPGGYLSADLYSELPLEKGNLIVVPRVNFLSIMLNRRAVENDMNRLFNREQAPESREDSIVQVVSGLMGEADLFLNLHDGHGFYSDTWISSERNPQRFGQSIIADTDTFRVKGRLIDLQAIAERVLQEVNEKITEPGHRMHFMNTRSFDADSRFREMVNSGTYHALVNHGIPSFGIESSKDLPSVEQKILYHNLAINEFMELYDIHPQVPGIRSEEFKLLFAHISINGAKAQVIYPGESLKLKAGDRVEVQHISAGTVNGLSCDVLGVGSYQDLGKAVELRYDTQIIYRKDAFEIGRTRIDVERAPIRPEQISYVIQLNDSWARLGHRDTLKLSAGDRFLIADVNSPDFRAEDIQVNMKGWVPDNPVNEGEDRHYLISAASLVWKKYSLNRQGKIYPLVVSLNGREISRLFVYLNF